jgi:anti-sigma factor RsiW
VTDYLEGALSPDERTRFELHLVVCDGCVRYLRQLRGTWSAAGRLSEAALSPEAWERLLRAFREWKGRRPSA